MRRHSSCLIAGFTVNISTLISKVVSPDGNDVYTSIHFDDKWFWELKHHLSQEFTNVQVYLGGMGEMGDIDGFPPAPVLISNFRYAQGNLFYPGNNNLLVDHNE